MTWSDLPADLLSCISSHLPVVNFLRSSAVCTSWNSALASKAVLRLHRPPSPWLLLPTDAGEASDALIFHELSIEEERGCIGYDRHLSSLSRYISGRRYFGSKDGWLVTLDKRDLQPRLFNPLTKAEISLPSLFTIPQGQGHRIKYKYASDGSKNFTVHEIGCGLRTNQEEFRDAYFQKIIASSNDLSGTVVVIYGIIKALALARPRDQSWVIGPKFPPGLVSSHLEYFEDVYYHDKERRFYAITCFSIVMAFDLDGKNVEVICSVKQNPRRRISPTNRMFYIVILSDTLLKIERLVKFSKKSDRCCIAKTVEILVFKFVPTIDASCSSAQWIPVNDLGDFSLFVGCNQTFSLHHKIAPGLKPNCIYFSDHQNDMRPDIVEHDTGLFDLHNDRFQYFFNSDSKPNWPPSIWLHHHFYRLNSLIFKEAIDMNIFGIISLFLVFIKQYYVVICSSNFYFQNLP